jgi:nucleotide-binding universal stress UspA family protein
MFKHILLPTDGSPLSEVAIKKGMQFARSTGAQVTGLYVIDPFHLFSTGGEMLSDSKERYEQDSRAHARSSLSVVYAVAKENGVSCDCISETNSHPYAVIVETAEKRGCDLIMMASHGRRGVQALLIGSETTKVLTHSKIPVLVLR